MKIVSLITAPSFSISLLKISPLWNSLFSVKDSNYPASSDICIYSFTSLSIISVIFLMISSKDPLD